MRRSLIMAALAWCCLGASAARAQNSADLAVTKTGPAQASAGSNVTYNIEVQNFGPDSSVSTTLSDPLPAGTTFVSFTSPAGWSCSTPAVGSGGTVSCNREGVPSGYDQTFMLTVRLDPEAGPGTTFTNIATISDPSDPNDENNSSAAVTTIPENVADVGVTKTTNESAALPDTDVSFTISVTNFGPNPATNVTLSDTLPGGLTFVSLQQSAG